MHRTLTRLIVTTFLLGGMTLRADTVVAPEATLHKLGTGMAFTEGAVWLPAADKLVFSDIPKGKLMQWTAVDGVTELRDCRKVNGNALDAVGRIVHCRHDARDLARTEADGSITVVAERFEGKRYNSPNDVAVKSDGSLWFTDPPWGLNGKREIDGNWVFRLAPDGTVTVVCKDLAMPNGLAFSPDESRLYVADTGGDAARNPNASLKDLPAAIHVFAVTPENGLQRRFTILQHCDGMTVDQQGRIYATGRKGIHVISPEGKELELIAVPEGPANCTFGGKNNTTLFITARTSLYAIELSTRGAGIPERTQLADVLSFAKSVDRGAAAKAIADADLRVRIVAMLPKIEQAAATRRRAAVLDAATAEVGGSLTFRRSAPKWLAAVAAPHELRLFDVVVGIDLYNGNNPMKKNRGGRNADVTDDWLPRLADFPSLESVSLANCEVRGPGLRHIAGLTAITDLNLTLTLINNEAFTHLVGLHNLGTLGLASARQQDGSGLAALRGLKKLANINLHYTPVADPGLAALSQLEINGHLWIVHAEFTDEGARHLARMRGLRSLGMGSMNKASSGAAVAQLSAVPLEKLKLFDRQSSAEGLTHAAKIQTLKELEVSGAHDVDDAVLRAVAVLPALQRFKLTGAAAVTDDGVLALAACKSLKALSIEQCPGITNALEARLRAKRPELHVSIKLVKKDK